MVKMESRLKQRLVGATVLAAVVVILLPMVLDDRNEPEQAIRSSNIPERPEATFRSRIVPLGVEGPSPAGTTAKGEKRSRDKAAAKGQKSNSAVSRVERGARDEKTGGKVSVKAPKVDSGRKPADGVRVGLTAWAIQLGSFSNAANAVGLRDRLRAKGLTAFVETVYVDKKKITRVYVGPELLRAKATESLKRLERDFKLKGLIVTYPGG